MSNDILGFPDSAFTNEAVMDLLALVDDRGWHFDRIGRIVDAEGKCPLCALAEEIDDTIQETRDAGIAIAFLFNPLSEQRIVLKEERVRGGLRSDDSWPYGRWGGERVGHITFSADCPKGEWREQLIGILKVAGDPEQAAKDWER